MGQCVRDEYIERLAKIAAELAGRDPNEHVTVKLANVTAFDNAMWRYPDFMMRAEAAYDALVRPHLVQSSVIDGYGRSLPTDEEQEATLR